VSDAPSREMTLAETARQWGPNHRAATEYAALVARLADADIEVARLRAVLARIRREVALADPRAPVDNAPPILTPKRARGAMDGIAAVVGADAVRAVVPEYAPPVPDRSVIGNLEAMERAGAEGER